MPRPAPVRLLTALLAACLAATCTPAESEPGAFPHARPHVRAVTLDAREAPAAGTLERLHALGVTHLTLVTFGFQPGLSAPEIRFSPDVRWYSESAPGIRTLARQADSLGIGLIMKPQLWIGRDAWSADIAFASEADWLAWEAQYHAFAMHAAHLARDVGADVLVVGTELGGPVRERPGFWRRLVADVRAVYDGRLTYAANWHDDYETVPFWDVLDYVGVQAYFPLSRTTDPSPEALRRGWQPVRARLEAAARRARRPVLFTEIGYRSVPYAAAEPWRWPSRDEHGAVAPDPALQARLYEAFFESVWNAPWFAGAIVWKWYPEAPTSRRLPRDLDFTPQDKPAEAVIREWFTKD